MKTFRLARKPGRETIGQFQHSTINNTKMQKGPGKISRPFLNWFYISLGRDVACYVSMMQGYTFFFVETPRRGVSTVHKYINGILKSQKPRRRLSAGLCPLNFHLKKVYRMIEAPANPSPELRNNSKIIAEGLVGLSPLPPLLLKATRR